MMRQITEQVEVRCGDCNQVMRGSQSCAITKIEIGGKVYQRDATHYDVNETCHDCGIVNRVGNVHHGGCDVEICPKCGEQFLTCKCERKGNTLDKEKGIIIYVEENAW